MRGFLPRIALLMSLCWLGLAHPALGQVANEWSIGADILVIGNMTEAPGLEALITDPTNPITQGLSLWRAESLGPVPEPLDDFGVTTYWLRDVDGDNYAEIVGLRHDPQHYFDGALGILDVASLAPRFSFKWTPIQSPDLGANLDFAQLSAQEPWALVNWDIYLWIYSSVTGNLLYDSKLRIGTGWRVNSVLVDDLDGDGAEEVLASFYDTGSGSYQLVMIGDRGVRTSAEPTTISSQILMQSRPNPTSGSTVIEYTLPQSGRVRLRVFDTAGRQVRTLVDEWTAAGSYSRQWNGKDDTGVAVASGIYFYELDVDGQRQTQKVVQIR